MNLPIYQHIHIRSSNIEELNQQLRPGMNLRQPVVFHIKEIDVKYQLKLVTTIEQYLLSRQLSFRFPYPIYIVCDLATDISPLHIISHQDELPRFYNQKDTRVHTRETHIIAKNKLLQQQIYNTDGRLTEKYMSQFTLEHRRIFEIEQERIFYRNIEERLKQRKKRG